QHAGQVELRIFLAVRRIQTGNLQQGQQVIVLRPLRRERNRLRDIEQAHGVLGTLQVTGHPVQVVGDAAQHEASSSTQVSLVPPPCEEFTTNEPSRKATRVRPPGTIWMSRPHSTNGRKSICRGATPSFTN